VLGSATGIEAASAGGHPAVWLRITLAGGLLLAGRHGVSSRSRVSIIDVAPRKSGPIQSKTGTDIMMAVGSFRTGEDSHLRHRRAPQCGTNRGHGYRLHPVP
jgi:hypothetical protein